jgi:CMP-N-acetylneuraminic acid synthetase
VTPIAGSQLESPRRGRGSDLLGIVPARRGSKTVPGKNKAIIAGKPLIQYTVSVLERAPSVAGILVTTDDEDILDLYRDSESVFLVRRPPELATDTASTSDAVKHALDAWIASGGEEPATIVLAQPTTPLRTVQDVEAAYALLRSRGEDSLISACRAEGMRHPMDMYRMEPDGHGISFMPAGSGLHSRATYETVYQRNGAIYMVTTSYFRRTGRLRSERPLIFEMPWVRSVNIDVPGDLLIATALIQSRLVDLAD